MRPKILLLLLIKIAYIYSQDGTRIIPLVRYDPYDIENRIKSSFEITSHSSYIEESDGRFIMKVNGKKLMTFVNKQFFIKEYIPENTLYLDSLFFISFDIDYKERENGLGFYPLKYYGVVEKGDIHFFRNKDKTKYSLPELIRIEFGSIDKFCEIQLQKYSKLLNFNSARDSKYVRGNGLYNKITKEYAKNFLCSDFSFYTDYPRLDKREAISLFISFLKENIVIEKMQELRLVKILSENPLKPQKKNFDINKFYNINFDYESFLDHDIIPILNSILDQYQMDIISSKFKHRIYMRNLCYFKIIKSERERQSRLKGTNTKFYSDKEMHKQICQLIFD